MPKKTFTPRTVAEAVAEVTAIYKAEAIKRGFATEKTEVSIALFYEANFEKMPLGMGVRVASVDFVDKHVPGTHMCGSSMFDDPDNAAAMYYLERAIVARLDCYEEDDERQNEEIELWDSYMLDEHFKEDKPARPEGIVRSSNGNITIDMLSGAVLNIEHDDPEKSLSGIVWFDLEDWKKRHPNELLPGEFDILDLAYVTSAGHREEAML